MIPSDWVAIDFDNDPDIDATLFFRKTKFGNKIQGIGHDGSKKSKEAVIAKQVELLNKKGWWVEASDALEHIMYKKKVTFISDESIAQKIFPNSSLTMKGDKGQYTRKLRDGKVITETIFGKPKI